MDTCTSHRFGKPVDLTRHATRRMDESRIPPGTVRDLIEAGVLKTKDERHCWIFKSYPDRNDNLVCAAVIDGPAVIIKTLMTHWREQPE